MNWLKALARPRFIFIFLGVVFACQTGFLFLFRELAAQGIPTTLDMMTGFTPDQARVHFALYGEGSRALLNWFQAVDVLFPVSYGFFFASLLAWLIGKLAGDGSRFSALGALGLAASVFDLLENTGIFIMARIFPGDIRLLASFTSMAGAVKNLMFLGSLLAIVVLAVVVIIRRVKTGPSTSAG